VLRISSSWEGKGLTDLQRLLRVLEGGARHARDGEDLFLLKLSPYNLQTHGSTVVDGRVVFVPCRLDGDHRRGQAGLTGFPVRPVDVI
jgi:hypothetical protein